ncbi:uncharacterized protein LOC106177522 isoform X2 [Lingula anatina]|uniref:Uncharacterized protein LOC106177522 isoform X2 n=1 Tax=Lingula anatina TaxID=7574 RepID=A0A1S3JZE6_LINAN|nr:uncharacterized protein LOC106177522 isoform X2 [Lingula anatina]|eukprot:XP_013415773.1 uncharacterized protein LOC106177522 isoform X2 [Lingula anatina]
MQRKMMFKVRRKHRIIKRPMMTESIPEESPTRENGGDNTDGTNQDADEDVSLNDLFLAVKTDMLRNIRDELALRLEIRSIKEQFLELLKECEKSTEFQKMANMNTDSNSKKPLERIKESREECGSDSELEARAWRNTLRLQRDMNSNYKHPREKLRVYTKDSPRPRPRVRNTSAKSDSDLIGHESSGTEQKENYQPGMKYYDSDSEMDIDNDFEPGLECYDLDKEYYPVNKKHSKHHRKHVSGRQRSHSHSADTVNDNMADSHNDFQSQGSGHLVVLDAKPERPPKPKLLPYGSGSKDETLVANHELNNLSQDEVFSAEKPPPRPPKSTSCTPPPRPPKLSSSSSSSPPPRPPRNPVAAKPIPPQPPRPPKPSHLKACLKDSTSVQYRDVPPPPHSVDSTNQSKVGRSPDQRKSSITDGISEAMDNILDSIHAHKPPLLRKSSSESTNTHSTGRLSFHENTFVPDTAYHTNHSGHLPSDGVVNQDIPPPLPPRRFPVQISDTSTPPKRPPKHIIYNNEKAPLASPGSYRLNNGQIHPDAADDSLSEISSIDDGGNNWARNADSDDTYSDNSRLFDQVEKQLIHPNRRNHINRRSGFLKEIHPKHYRCPDHALHVALGEPCSYYLQDRMSLIGSGEWYEHGSSDLSDSEGSNGSDASSEGSDISDTTSVTRTIDSDFRRGISRTSFQSGSTIQGGSTLPSTTDQSDIDNDYQSGTLTDGHGTNPGDLSDCGSVSSMDATRDSLPDTSLLSSPSSRSSYNEFQDIADKLSSPTSILDSGMLLAPPPSAGTASPFSVDSSGLPVPVNSPIMTDSGGSRYSYSSYSAMTDSTGSRLSYASRLSFSGSRLSYSNITDSTGSRLSYASRFSYVTTDSSGSRLSYAMASTDEYSDFPPWDQYQMPKRFKQFQIHQMSYSAENLKYLGQQPNGTNGFRQPLIQGNDGDSGITSPEDSSSIPNGRASSVKDVREVAYRDIAKPSASITNVARNAANDQSLLREKKKSLRKKFKHFTNTFYKKSSHDMEIKTLGTV